MIKETARLKTNKTAQAHFQMMLRATQIIAWRNTDQQRSIGMKSKVSPMIAHFEIWIWAEEKEL